jgi:hypothetical protein
MTTTYHRLRELTKASNVMRRDMELQLPCGDGKGGTLTDGPKFTATRDDILKVSDDAARQALPAEFFESVDDDAGEKSVTIDVDKLISDHLDARSKKQPEDPKTSEHSSDAKTPTKRPDLPELTVERHRKQ